MDVIFQDKIQKKFIKYTEKYNLEDINLKRKQEHSIRVMKICIELANKLNLSEEEVELSALIGLLHDIARFEQYTKYGTFRDIESVDHGDYAIGILKNELRKYIETNKYDEIIKKAIKNHNKYKIEEGLNEKEELFAKLIRDADKIDIFYESAEIFWKGKEYIVEESKIGPEIVQQFENETQIKRGTRKNSEINRIICVIAFIFDINFKPSFDIIKQNDYINRILDRYDMKDEYTKQQLQKIRDKANKYIGKE
jgi:HD superfamily phosphohydrolase YqeK